MVIATQPAAARGTRTIRVSVDVYDQLAERAKREGRNIGDVVTRLIQAEADRAFFAEIDRAAKELRADPEAWAEYEAEMAVWDALAGDALTEDDW